jgi:uncharacterized protein
VSAHSTARAALLAFLLGCFGLSPWLALAQVPVPPLTARVTDQTATLTPEQQATIEQTLAHFESRTGSQIALLIVPTTAPEAVEQYALRVAEEWKLGRKGVDDGALLLVAKDDRALRIEAGYGLEGALNDAVSKRIISEIIVPRFQAGDFYGGLVEGIDRMIGVIGGEALPPPRERTRQGGEDGLGAYLPVVFIAALVIGGILRAMFGRVMGSLFTGGAVGFLAWLFAGLLSVALMAGVIAALFTLLGGFGGRGLGGGLGGLGGLGGRGGFGGGGFGGGGGGFGGGGASGRW